LPLSATDFNSAGKFLSELSCLIQQLSVIL
jgi:hypothetical protein